MIKLKIASKIGILASVLVLMTALIIGNVAVRETIRYNIENEVEITFRDKLVVDKVPFYQEIVSDLINDLQVEADREIMGRVILSHLAETQGFDLKDVDELEDPRRRPWEADWKRVVVGDPVWQSTLRNNRDYLDVSLFDPQGGLLMAAVRKQEGTVGVTRTREGTPTEKAFVRAAINLNGSHGGASTLARTYLSPIDWEDHEGVEVPILRVGVAVLIPGTEDYPDLPEGLEVPPNGTVFGVLGITLSLNPVVERLARVSARKGAPQGLEELPQRAEPDPKPENTECIFVTDGRGYFLTPVWEGSEVAFRDRQIQDLYPSLTDFVNQAPSPNQVAVERIDHLKNSKDHEGVIAIAPFGPPNSIQHIGLAMVAPYPYLENKATSGNEAILQATIILGVLSSLIAFFSVTWLLRRLKPLSVSATRIADGDYNLPLPPGTGDEIGELATAFSQMVDKVKGREAELQQSKDELQEHKEDLEDEVDRRTQALRKAHDSLKEHSEALKKTNMELAVARDRALEAGRAKSEFFAKMSHELKSPLTVIILAAESLEEEAEEIEGAEDLVMEVRDILVAAWTLYEQITSILDISKIEAGKLEVNLDDFDLRDLLESEIVRPIKYLALKKNNRFEVEIENNVQTLHSDRTLVKNALYNLLSNACKFTEEGTVKLKVSRKEEASGDRTLFEITDTGIGMSEDQLKKIFKVFSQVDASTSSKYGGHGLGLANVRNYCEILGGEVSVTSESGEGSRFTIDLPTHSTKHKTRVSAPPAVPAPTPPPEVSARTVLVIDDDQRWRENLLRVLTREGFHVVTASSGEEGLRHARTVQPAVITLDVSMPTMDGWSVLAELKNDPELAEIPVVMVTLVENQKVAYRLGAERLFDQTAGSRQTPEGSPEVPRPGERRPRFNRGGRETGPRVVEIHLGTGRMAGGSGRGRQAGPPNDGGDTPLPGPARPADAGNGWFRVHGPNP